MYEIDISFRLYKPLIQLAKLKKYAYISSYSLTKDKVCNKIIEIPNQTIIKIKIKHKKLGVQVFACQEWKTCKILSKLQLKPHIGALGSPFNN